MVENGLLGLNTRFRIICYLDRGNLLEQPHFLEVALISTTTTSEYSCLRHGNDHRKAPCSMPFRSIN